MKVYKVFHRDQHGLRSVSQFMPHTFSRGRPTNSPEAPIFAFARDHLYWAKAYCRLRTSPHELWECISPDGYPMTRIIHLLCPELLDANKVMEWWQGLLSLKTMPTKPGTVACSSITPIKQIVLR